MTRIQRRNAISPNSNEAFILRTFSYSLNISGDQSVFNTQAHLSPFPPSSHIGKRNINVSGPLSHHSNTSSTAPAA